jgi:hypothetical protein
VIRALGDTAIYAAVALFHIGLDRFYLFRDRFELARLFITGAIIWLC